MIFGFNTDVKSGEIVYHVQSEARANDLLLQTQVFEKGRCIGKMASSYAERILQPDFSSEQMHELLKHQHKLMLDAVREGKHAPLFTADGEVQDVNGTGLAIKWLNSDVGYSQGEVLLRLYVADNRSPADGALVTSRLAFSLDAPIHSQSMTESDGSTELQLTIPDEPAPELAVLVRAKFDDKSVTRKFRLKRSS